MIHQKNIIMKLMETKEILNGSKLIAEYLGWRYIPFNDLQGHSCAGWWKIAKPVFGDDDLGKYMLAKTKDHKDKLGRSYYVCRNHGDLRFWNSLDALVPVIKKIEKEFKDVKFHLNNNGCEVKVGKCWEYSSFTLPEWSNNIFKAVVETIKDLQNG